MFPIVRLCGGKARRGWKAVRSGGRVHPRTREGGGARRLQVPAERGRRRLWEGPERWPLQRPRGVPPERSCLPPRSAERHEKGPPFRMALSRASDSIKLLSRSDHSASQMSLHKLLFAVSPPPVATDENGADTCTWYTKYDRYLFDSNSHVILINR